MKPLSLFTVIVLAIALVAASAAYSENTVRGKYLEVRSCDVYTGPCFANAEEGLSGKEAILTWAVDQGQWKGVALDGLKVIAVVLSDRTLGSVANDSCRTKSIVIVDQKATSAQREALLDLARTAGGPLVCNVIAVKSSPIEATVSSCSKSGCGAVKAGDLVEVSTRCLGGKDHLCGNETTYYPPLTKVENAIPAFTNVSRYSGDGLEITWNEFDRRSAFLAAFAY